MPATTNSYELTYILDEQSTPESAKKKAAEMKKLVEGLDGKIAREELWGRRELAYEIKKNRTGFYTTLWLDLPAGQLKALDRQLRFDESIIRSLVTRTVEYSQPGSLTPVVETAPVAMAAMENEKASAEAMLRMGSSIAKKAETEDIEALLEDELPEEERLKKLDEKLDELLSEDSTVKEESPVEELNKVEEIS